MNAIQKAREALLAACKPIELEAGFIVPTPFTFPEGDPVRVTIIPHQDGKVLLSDAGETMRNYVLWGGNPDRVRKGFKAKASWAGLHVDNTLALLTPPVPAEAVPAWIGLLGQAAAEMAEWLMERHAKEAAIGIRELLDARLEEHFGDRLERNAQLQGASGKVHKFHWLVRGESRNVVLDVATPDGAAVYAAFSKHMDLAMEKPANIINRIAYDPDDKWRPGDLNFLQEAAPLVNYRTAVEEVDRLAA